MVSRLSSFLLFTCVIAGAAEIAVPGASLSAKSPGVVPVESGYDGLVVCHGQGGFEEWTANLPEAGNHYIHFRFCSGNRRPCQLSLDGQVKEKEALDSVTGGFLAGHLKWATYGPYPMDKGARKVRLDAKGHMPHFLGLVVSDNATPPKPDVLPTPKVAKAAKAARKPPPPPQPIEEPSAEEIAATRDAVGRLAGTDEIIFIKRLTYTANHYYTEFINARWSPGGNICVLSLKDGTVRELLPELTGGVFCRFDLSFDGKRVVFDYKKAPLEGYRIYEANIDGTGLRQLTFSPENEADLVKSYQVHGLYHHGTDDMHPCYLPDGGIAFISTRCQYGVLCDSPDNFTCTVLYRMDADGGNMHKLSSGALSEAAPVAMTDGRILYTRWEYVDKGAVSVKCLWAMNPDGSGSAEVYGNTLSLPPTLIYARDIPGSPGKYVTCGVPHYPQNGVGTIIRLDMNKPIRTREPMTYMTPCTDIRAEGGFDFRDGEGNWRRDRSGRGPLYRDPFPLSEDRFLVAHKPEGPEWSDATSYDLYLLDDKGDVRCFLRDKTISCWQPMPLASRRRPPIAAGHTDPELAARNQAVCVVTNVYHGLTDVEPGEVRHIRVLEQIPRFWSARRRWGGDGYDQQHVCITKDTHLGLKVQHGVVPVEPDGSAHFIVPAGRNIVLQALDENYMAVQTERTFVNYAPGEQRSCIGCHETPQSALGFLQRARPTALERPPSLPGPQPGETVGARPLHYPSDVQPVLDAHCIKCHSGDKPPRGLDLTGTPTDLFSRSYESLIPERRRGKGRRGPDLVGPVIGENHPKTGLSRYYPGGDSVAYMPAKTLGSHASVLVAMLSKGKVRLRSPEQTAYAAPLVKQHQNIDLKPEELLKITNWVDTNGQYYGSYWGRRHIRYQDHPNFRPVPTFPQAVSPIPPLPEDKR